MKKIVAVCLCLISLTSFSFGDKVEEISTKEAIEVIKVSDDNQKDKIGKYLEKRFDEKHFDAAFDNTKSSKQDLNFDNINEINVITYFPIDLDYSKKSDVNKILKSGIIEYEAIITDESDNVINTAALREHDGDFVMGLGTFVPIECIEYYSNYKNIEETIEYAGYDTIKNYSHIRIRDIKTDLLLFEADKSLKCIPLTYKEETLNINNFEVYEAEKVFGEIKSYYNNLEKLKNDRDTKIGGAGISNYKLYNMILAFAIGAAILLSFIFMRKRTHNK
jgi:hypothetical protein